MKAERPAAVTVALVAWLMLGREGEALQVRGGLQVTCWCSDGPRWLFHRP